MKAVVHSQYGNPEVLQVTTLERPVLRKNEVLVPSSGQVRGKLVLRVTAWRLP